MAKNTVIVSVLADTKQFAKGFQESASVLSRVTSLGGAVVKTAAGITAAVVGMAAAGGFARALKLDEARTQLGALGYSGQQMQGIMNSALASVKGTAFGLDAAATIAAQALASGVKPGEQLTASLTTVANTAALAKTDMGEMGSIFAKVWANGKVTTQEMNQLADRGVPIWQYLGQSFNVSNAELRKMIEAGDITADMFMNSLGPAVDGMATRMSSGFKGMAMNAMAALSRVGAMFAGPLIDSAKGFLGEATTLTDGLGTRLQPVADKWAAFLGQFSSSGLAAGALGFLDKITASVGGVVQFVTTFSPLSILLHALAPVFPQLAASLAQLGQALAGGLVALGPSLVDVLGSLLTLAAQIVPPVASLVSWVIANREWLSGLGVAAGVVGGVVAAVSAFKAVQLGVVAATYGVQGALLVAGNAAKVYGVIQAVVSNATKVAAAAQAVFNAVMNANPVMLIVTAIGALVAGLVYFFTQTKLGKQIWAEFTRFLSEAWNNIVTVAKTVFTALGNFFKGFWDGIVAGWNAVVEFVTPIFEVIGALIKGYIDIWVNIFIVFAAVLKTIWDAIVSVVTTVWNAIVAFLTPIVQWISDYINNAILGVQLIWNAIWGAISSFFTGIWNGIVAFLTPIVQAVSNVISGAVNTVQGIWNAVWGAISSFFTGIWNGIVSTARGAMNGVVSVVTGIQGAVMGALSGAGRWLVDVGRNIIQGLVDGIGGAFNWVKNIIQDLGGNILGWAKGVLGIKSPSREFMKIGGFIGQGLGNGIAATTSLVRNATERLAGTVVDSFSADLNGGVNLSIASPDAQRGGNVYNINVTGGIQSGAEIGRAIVDAIREYEAAGGRA